MTGNDDIRQLGDVIRAAKNKTATRTEMAAELPPPRNLVVCCDGTGNEFGNHTTNVVKLFGLLLKEPERQLTYYDPGVGTLSPPSLMTWLGKWVAKLWGLAFGYGITANIEDAYQFLMNNYRPGDKVFLFGFSRGAYTVRALAGMIHRCGLLPKGSDNLIPYVTKMYRHGSDEMQAGFKAFFTTHNECKPHFVGVWDTVKSVSFFVQKVFKDTVMNEDVRHGRHALAIDERRGMYEPVLWTLIEGPQTQHHAMPRQVIKQVWFAGAHSDVGGGYPNSDLSDISLKWMLNEALAEELKLVDGWEQGVKPVPQGELHNSLKPFWWILPFHRRRISSGADIHPTLKERHPDLQSYVQSIERPVGRFEWLRGGIPAFAVLAAIGFALPFAFWLLTKAIVFLANLVGACWATLIDFISVTTLPVLALFASLGMILLGLVIWGVRWWNGGD